ncbi:DUF1127 domain-containing protein [Pseudotabrizicola algicola]|nr:DUF1127 domain-containing protein [Pseudotabrizicola algicola]
MGRPIRSEDDEEEKIMAYTNTQTVAGIQVGGWMGDVLAKWNVARERRAVYLQTLNELSAMSDRDLADINVARVSIEDIARQAAYGK